MSVPVEPRERKKRAQGFRPVRIAKLVLLIVLGVGGYAAFQLAPAWLQFVSGSSTAPLRRQAGVLFVDALLIAYPLALVASIVGTIVLVCLQVRARAARAAGSLLRARLLLLCGSILLSLTGLEAGAAAWRWRLHQSPELPRAKPSSEASGKADAVTGKGGDDPRLPNKFSGAPTGSSGTAPPMRILVIGESSGRGEPYHPWLSVAQIAAWRLEKVFPGRSIQVDMWAIGGAILESMHKKLAELTYRPDALMVYVGHNEFQGRYAWMRDVDYYLDDDRVPMGAKSHKVVTSFLRLSPLYQLLDETRERQRLDSIPPHIVTRELVDRPLCTRAEAQAIADDFRRRLESIAVYCESIGTLADLRHPAWQRCGLGPEPLDALGRDAAYPARGLCARLRARAGARKQRPRRSAAHLS